MNRLLFDIAIMLAVTLLPGWIAAILIFGCLLFFNSFYEAIIAGFMMDLLYGRPTALLFHSTLVYTLAFAILFLVAEVLKERIMLYDRG